jgi:hypothetical protein
MTLHKKESISMVGDPKEGMVVLPGKDLKEKY